MILSFTCSSPSAIALAPSSTGRQWTSSANPLDFAKSNRVRLMSIATILEAPLNLARAHARRPMGPAPKTRTVCPCCKSALEVACRRTERGSARAPSSYEQPSGRLGRAGYCQLGQNKVSKLTGGGHGLGDSCIAGGFHQGGERS